MPDSPASPSTDEARPVARADLSAIFRSSEKPSQEYRIGAEQEKFGIYEQTTEPVGYDTPTGITRILAEMAERYGWHPVRERPAGPVIALSRGLQSITLEPGGQLELSGAPERSLHAIEQELSAHHAELEPISRELGIVWLCTGFHPLARVEQLPWVPKTRYPIMREYLPTKGPAAHDMMLRTATVQANYDYSSEADALKKVVTGLKLTPILHALFANAPFKEGRAAERLSERGEVWLHMDPSRSGLIPGLWQTRTPGYEDYIEWALDAGMFLIWRDGQALRNTGQTFRDYLENGFLGHRATMADFRLHLATLFPEIRLKSTLEVRPCDALPPKFEMAALAVWTGLLYDDQALEQASELSRDFDYAQVSLARPELVRRGLDAPFLGRPHAWDLAGELLTIAAGGLERRAAALDEFPSEAPFLEVAFELVAAKTSPARLARAHAASSGSILQATRFPG